MLWRRCSCCICADKSGQDRRGKSERRQKSWRQRERVDRRKEEKKRKTEQFPQRDNNKARAGVMERNEAVCSWQKWFSSRLSCWKCHQLQRQAAGGRTRSVDSNEKRRIPNNNERRLHRRSLGGCRAGCLFGCHQTHADELCHLLVSTEDSLQPDFCL